MKLQGSDTAILVFIRSEWEELANKTFYRSVGYKGNLKIAKYLNQQTLKVAHSAGLPVFVSRTEDQTGDSFGDRISNAIAKVYQDGFEKVIVVGNDTLALNSAHLQSAINLLENQPVVLGPSEDGGVYLIGLHKSVFNKEQFKNLPWQSAELFKVLQTAFPVQGLNHIYLQKACDVDSEQDLVAILKDSFLTKEWFQLLGWYSDVSIFLKRFASLDQSISIYPRRGPPTPIFA